MSDWALVTGASSGIGRALSLELARARIPVIAAARSRPALEQLAEELRASGAPDALPVSIDLTAPEGPAQLLEAAKDRAIGYLVNNAGFGSNGRFHELPLQGELGQVDLNVRALVELTHRCVGPMLERRAGRILNIASTAAFQAGPLMSTYYATKAFVLSFSEGLAAELADSGVTVTCHCPGPTESNFGATAGNDASVLFKRAKLASSEDVARHAFRAMMKGKRVAIYGAANWFGALSTRLAPRSTAAAIAMGLNRRA